MQREPFGDDDRRGVFAVPPIARRDAPGRPIDFPENDRVVRHIAAGGVTRFIYGGNAFLYHLSLAEYEALLEWMAALPGELLAIPSLGPSFGRALDQAPLLRRHRFACAMALPCGDPRDARGLEAGLREIADAAGLGLIVYLKEEQNFGRDPEAGLDAVARLVDDGVCVGIKYAVVRSDPSRDDYLGALLERVDRRLVISGIGERPAGAHMTGFGLPGFTTGSGCLAPGMSDGVFRACVAGDGEEALRLRERFLPLEDRRDALGPARVLHAAVELGGIAKTGPVPPFVTALGEPERAALAAVARQLLDAEAAFREARPGQSVDR